MTDSELQYELRFHSYASMIGRMAEQMQEEAGDQLESDDMTRVRFELMHKVVSQIWLPVGLPICHQMKGS